MRIYLNDDWLFRKNFDMDLLDDSCDTSLFEEVDPLLNELVPHPTKTLPNANVKNAILAKFIITPQIHQGKYLPHRRIRL